MESVAFGHPRRCRAPREGRESETQNCLKLSHKMHHTLHTLLFCEGRFPDFILRIILFRERFETDWELL
jgi:hypothetical protein